MDIFCKIINNEIPSYTIYEDEIVKCFLDISPDSNGHTLIVPKKHYQDLLDIDDLTLIHIMHVAQELIRRLEERMKIDGVTLIQNNGLVQEVKHFHLHLKPYYEKEQILMNVEDVYDILK